MDSEYNGSYTAFGTTEGGFNISLYRVPEQGDYTVGAAASISYSTRSSTASGGIFKLNLTSGGHGYKNIPGISSITSTNGIGANLLALSSTINKVKDVRITDPGFDYHSDRTLRPDARLSPTVTLINSDSITDIQITDGGVHHTSVPELVIVDPDTGKLTSDQGVIELKLTANSVSSVSYTHLTLPTKA